MDYSWVCPNCRKRHGYNTMKCECGYNIPWWDKPVDPLFQVIGFVMAIVIAIYYANIA